MEERRCCELHDPHGNDPCARMGLLLAMWKSQFRCMASDAHNLVFKFPWRFRLKLVGQPNTASQTSSAYPGIALRILA